MKILIVDDDQFALDILQTVLIAANYDDVTSANSAECALDIISSAPAAYECIFLDIRMPGMDGIELCKVIRDMPAYRFIPIIMITVVTDQNSINLAMAAGATDYVTKPFRGLELGARLRSASAFANMLRLNQKEVERSQRFAKQLDAFLAHDLHTPIPLEVRDGVVSDLQMENGLLKLPDGFSGLELVAIAISNIREVFKNLAESEFRGFLNEVAGHVLSTFGNRSCKIAYFGNGTFVVIARKNSGCNVLRENVRSSLAGKDFVELEGTNLQPDFVTETPGHANFWSGDAAAKGLVDVLRDVQSKCADRVAQSKLNEFRIATINNDFQPSPKNSDFQPPPKEWLENSVLSLWNIGFRVTPRRVTRSVQGKAQKRPEGELS
tara:strand:+ start:469 stop:1608 length:1140 start_codon:yes stop_codon:yes gene_type:complete